ncbi:MAG: hypothetical protein IJI53_08680 [Clostridia bacterium]|nr:hypothetical protein [Clostridia bacterium]MBR0408098.1 hypothetical protein [Clostridia bacterium]
MKKAVALMLSLMLILSAAAALAEGEVLLGQVDYAAHGTGCFAVITVALQDDVILAAKIDEFQYVSDRENLAAVGVPNSDASFGENYPEGKVLGSKRVNNELYSLNMQRAGSTVQIAANYDAIEAFVKGKTIAELEEIVGGYTAETKGEFIDAVTGATTADTWTYTQGILAAAKAAKNETGTYTFYNKTGETVTELYLIDNLTGEKGVNYAVNGFAADAQYTITRTITPEEKEAGYSMTVSFKTEGGYEGHFDTLHIEVAPITLLAADAMTGATMISFFAPAAE